MTHQQLSEYWAGFDQAAKLAERVSPGRLLRAFARAGGLDKRTAAYERGYTDALRLLIRERSATVELKLVD